MPWATVNEIYASVAARMSTTTANNDAVNPGIMALAIEAEESARMTVTSAMVGRGYTVDQVNQWDAQHSWHLRIAACHFFRADSANKAVQGYIDPTAGVCKAEKQLTEPEEGAAVVLTINGVDPLAAQSPMAGVLNYTPSDLALQDDVRGRWFDDPARIIPNPPGPASPWSWGQGSW